MESNYLLLIISISASSIITCMIIRKSYRLIFLIIFTGFLLVKASYGQTTVGSQPAPSHPQSATLQMFLQEQGALVQEEQALMAQGATEQQIKEWRTKNASRLEAQQERAKDMAAESAVESVPVVASPKIPANASPTLKNFLVTQTVLLNARAQIHNQLLQAMPSDVTEEQIAQMQQKEDQLFQQQHGEELQAQTQRAQILTQESRGTPLPVPGPTPIPPNATPQLAAFLTLSDQLMREEMQLHNQYLTATSTVRDAALEQWRQQNAARFEQMQTLAQSMSASTSN